MSGARVKRVHEVPVGRDISDDDWESFDKAARKHAAEAIRRKSSGPIHKFGIAVRLIGLADPEAMLGDDRENLREHDLEAYRVLEPRKALVDARRAELFQTTEVQTMLAEAKAAAVTKLGSGRAKAYHDYLMSLAFAAVLDKKSASDRTAHLSKCLVRLHTLDPSLAEAVAEHWIGQQICQNPIALLQSLPAQHAERALLDLLEVLVKLSHEEQVRCGVVPADLRGGPPGGPLLSLHKCLADEPSRTAIARALVRGVRAPSFRDVLERVGTDRALDALARYDHRGARFFESLKRSDPSRRMLSTILGAWGLIASATSPNGAAGDEAYRHRRAAASLQAAVAFIGSADETLCAAGDAFNWLRTAVTGKRYRLIATGATAPNRLHLLAKLGPIDKACKFLGPLADALSLYVSALNVGVEMRNQDPAGVVASIGGCISAVGGFCYGLTVIGGAAFPPFLIASAVIAVGSYLLNEFAGESSLTGQIKNDLRALGVFRSEDRALADYKTSVRSNSTGRSLNRTTVRGYRGASTLSLNKRLEVIRDSRSVPGNFVYLIEATDPTRIADELENDNEARDVMLWTLDAYQALGRPPGRGFSEQLLEHCSQHRSYLVVRFFCELDRPQRSKAFDRLDGAVIRKAAGKLCKGHTNGQDECALSTLLAHATLQQLDAVFGNDRKFARRVEDELTSKQWKELYRRMVSKKASSRLRAAAEYANR